MTGEVYKQLNRLPVMGIVCHLRLHEERNYLLQLNCCEDRHMGGAFHLHTPAKYHALEYLLDLLHACTLCDPNKSEFHECRSRYLLHVRNCSFNPCRSVIERSKETKLKQHDLDIVHS